MVYTAKYAPIRPRRSDAANSFGGEASRIGGPSTWSVVPWWAAEKKALA